MKPIDISEIKKGDIFAESTYGESIVYEATQDAYKVNRPEQGEIGCEVYGKHVITEKLQRFFQAHKNYGYTLDLTLISRGENESN